MNNHTSFKLFALSAAALFFAQVSFGQSCSEAPGYPNSTLGYVQTGFVCSLSDTSSTYNVDLSPFIEAGGGTEDNNDVGTAYLVVTTDNPATASLSTLEDVSDWAAVLYLQNNQAGLGSSLLTMYWPGDFPSATTVVNYDNTDWPAYSTQSFFFQESPGGETVLFPGSPNVYDVYTPAVTSLTPEPSSFTLLFSGVLGLGLFAARKRIQNALGQRV
jgi:hypothetical protein